MKARTDAKGFVGIRLPTSLIGRLDAHASRLQADLPGLAVSRSDAIRLLLSEALDRAEAGAKGKG